MNDTKQALEAVVGLVEKATDAPVKVKKGWGREIGVHCKRNPFGEPWMDYPIAEDVNGDRTPEATRGTPRQNAEFIAAAWNLFRTHGPALLAALEDAARLDALEAEVASGGPIVLHNGEGTNGMRGLGMTNTGRTLRKAIDSCCGLDAMAAGGES